jgi:hypothetical protein
MIRPGGPKELSPGRRPGVQIRHQSSPVRGVRLFRPILRPYGPQLIIELDPRPSAGAMFLRASGANSDTRDVLACLIR